MYLKRFTSDGGLLAVFDIQENRRFRADPKNIAVSVGFNNLDVGGVEVSTESWLAGLESRASPLLDRIIQDPQTITSLSEQEQNDFARFVCAQFFRVPEYRDRQRSTFSTVADQIERAQKASLLKTYGQEEGNRLWESQRESFDSRWRSMESEDQQARLSASMLEAIQGIANLLVAMPWRVGTTHSALPLFTSDNPVSRRLPSVRPWWEEGSFTAFRIYYPLSSRVLFIAGPGLDPRVTADGPYFGGRQARDFSLWQTSIARHTVACEATRFLFGDQPLPRECAESCLDSVDQASLDTAMKYAGFDPHPPRMDS